FLADTVMLRRHVEASIVLFLVTAFLSQYYGHHGDLHSFPTRRSSDLQRRTGAGRGCVGRPVRPGTRRRRRPCRVPRLPDRAARRDRKSTRLNSSHVKISYAVFCLKKKKNQQNYLDASNREYKRHEPSQ